MHFCRKSDPESKGKIENVIKYIKYNFLRGRKYHDIDTLNSQALAWLNRTANAKVHATTRKIPRDEWIIEKQHLKAANDIFIPEQSLDTYIVRKDNTIKYKNNFYGLPLGTYQGPQTRLPVRITDDNMIVISDNDNNEIVSYKISLAKGKLISKSNFKRDYSSKIDKLIDELSGLFKNPQKVRDYFLKIRQDNPRYIRDQLQIIKKLTVIFDMNIINQALNFCIDNKIYKATDFESVAKKIKADDNTTEICKETIEVKTINKSTFKIIPQKSNISDYQKLMN